jgi:hypothetical protein
MAKLRQNLFPQAILLAIALLSSGCASMNGSTDPHGVLCRLPEFQLQQAIG